MSIRKRRDISYGFTTIELVVVVLFVGVLAFSAFLVSSNSRAEKRDELRLMHIETLQRALADYFDIHGGYPSSLEVGIVEEGFLTSLPHDPKTGDAYIYAPLNIGCTSYHLGAVLENSEHEALVVDIDAGVGTVGTGCPDGADGREDFSGDDPLYDVKP